MIGGTLRVIMDCFRRDENVVSISNNFLKMVAYNNSIDYLEYIYGFDSIGFYSRCDSF